MNCPFCGAPMEDGVLFGRRDCGILWLPNRTRKRPFFGISDESVKKQGGMRIGTFRDLHEGYQAPFSICRACRKGLADLSGELETN